MLGAVAGFCHFTAVARETDGLLIGKDGSLRLVGLRLGRLALTGAVLVIASRPGWPALLAATLGIMAGRQVVMCRLGTIR
jgi:F1F0 ATPase subunit 2